MSRRAIGTSAAIIFLSATVVGCGKNPATNAVAAAPGTPQATNLAPSAPLAVSADPTKTGPDYVEELKQNPALFAKQKEICGGRGASFQPRVELQAPCAAWETARSDLEIDEQLHENKVKNTSSL
jgi:hypothetical protein